MPHLHYTGGSTGRWSQDGWGTAHLARKVCLKEGHESGPSRAWVFLRTGLTRTRLSVSWFPCSQSGCCSFCTLGAGVQCLPDIPALRHLSLAVPAHTERCRRFEAPSTLFMSFGTRGMDTTQHRWVLSGLFHAGMSHNYQKATVTAWHLRGVVWSLRRYRTSFLKEESSAARPMSTGDPGLIRPQFIDTGHHVIGLITELGGFRLALHGIAMVSKCVQSVRHRSDLRKSTGAVSARLSRRARATLQALRQVQPRTEGYPRRNGSPEAGLTFLGRKKWTEMIKHFLSSQFAHCSCFLSWPIDAFCGQS